MATRARTRTAKASAAATAALLATPMLEPVPAQARASEIRLREGDREEENAAAAESAPRSTREERDTEPAPAPAFDEEARAPWLDLDRELTLDLLRLEDAAHDNAERPWATHVVAAIEDVEGLGDALFALWSRARVHRAIWNTSLPRIYSWARDVLAEIADAIELDFDAPSMARAFGRIAAYSSLLVDGLVRPALAQAIALADADDDEGELERLRAIHERISLLKWTLMCAARSRA